MSTEKRNYDEELTVLLRIARENNFLIPSSFTAYVEIEQTITPVVHWIDNQTSSKEVKDVNA